MTSSSWPRSNKLQRSFNVSTKFQLSWSLSGLNEFESKARPIYTFLKSFLWHPHICLGPQNLRILPSSFQRMYHQLFKLSSRRILGWWFGREEIWRSACITKHTDRLNAALHLHRAMISVLGQDDDTRLWQWASPGNNGGFSWWVNQVIRKSKKKTPRPSATASTHLHLHRFPSLHPLGWITRAKFQFVCLMSQLKRSRLASSFH